MRRGSQNYEMLADNTLETQNKCAPFAKMLLETSQRRKPAWLNKTLTEAILK